MVLEVFFNLHEPVVMVVVSQVFSELNGSVILVVLVVWGWLGQVVLEVFAHLHQSVRGGGVVQGHQVVLEAFSNLSESLSG